ncbi:PH domain-containing protein [Shewanella sp. YIC-542]|uniref:PH domain-containing protein n=1 Tax=Shewanella mytili TaxID=3377111 RepID=UPI00398F6675
MDSHLFALAPLGKTAHISFLVLFGVLGGLLLYLLLKPKPGTIRAVPATILLAIMGFTGWLYWQANAAGLTLSAKTLDIRVPLYSQSIALTHLQVSQAKVINGADEARPSLSLRTNGVGMPGYHLGWFRLDAGTKAFVAVSGVGDMLWIPTDLGYDLLLAPAEPQAVLQMLQARFSAPAP